MDGLLGPQVPKKASGAAKETAPDPIAGFTALHAATLCSWYRALWDAVLSRYAAAAQAAHSELKASKAVEQSGALCQESQACALTLAALMTLCKAHGAKQQVGGAGRLNSG